MIKKTALLFFLIVLSASSWAQESSVTNTFSPKLKKFVSSYPKAEKTLENAISMAFSNRTVRLYYFYSEDNSQARAFHYYPGVAGMPEVAICVQENQTPLDEFITILFETINSKHEAEFAQLSQEAYSGTISREQFAKQILRYEFEACKNCKSIIMGLKFPTKAVGESYYYRKFIECPDDFDGFLSYSKKISQRSTIEEYELNYDSLRKAYSESNAISNSPANTVK